MHSNFFSFYTRISQRFTFRILSAYVKVFQIWADCYQVWWLVNFYKNNTGRQETDTKERTEIEEVFEVNFIINGAFKQIKKIYIESLII